MSRTWLYLQNPFLNAAGKNYKKALKISTYTNSQLTERQADSFFGPLFSMYSPLHQALANAFNTWKTSGGIHKGATLSIDQLLKLLSPGKINAWDYAVMGVFPKGSPFYTAIFPQGHKPYQTGEIDQRINAVAQLAQALAGKPELAATLADVQDFYTQLSDARSGQQGTSGKIGSNSDTVNAAVTDAMKGLYNVLGSCMAQFTDDPTQAEPMFDLETIRNHDQVIFTGILDAAEVEVAVVHTFSTQDEVTISNTGPTGLIFYLAATAVNAVNGIGKSLNAGESINVTAAELGDVANRYLHVHNMDDVSEGHYKVEL